MIAGGGLAAFLLLSFLLPGSGDKHSLFYLFTVQSEVSSHNIYQFSVETLLNDTQTDSYSSRDGIRTPKQSWVKEIEESEWRTGSEKLKYEGQWMNKSLQTHIEAFRHKASERHVLQWRNGCEGEKLPDGSVSTLNCINEYGYDGEDLMSYNWTSRQWSVSVKEAQEMVEKLKSEESPDPALVCQDCVKWIRIYLQYSPQHTPTVPDVYVFVKKSQTESSRLTLTCLATGFYPKDLKMRLRRFTTSLPDHLLTSSGVRPNGDGTYQLRKSVDVQEEDTARYDCIVTQSGHKSVIKEWGNHCLSVALIGVIIGGGVLLSVLSRIMVVFIKKRRADRNDTNWQSSLRVCLNEAVVEVVVLLVLQAVMAVNVGIYISRRNKISDDQGCDCLSVTWTGALAAGVIGAVFLVILLTKSILVFRNIKMADRQYHSWRNGPGARLIGELVLLVLLLLLVVSTGIHVSLAAYHRISEDKSSDYLNGALIGAAIGVLIGLVIEGVILLSLLILLIIYPMRKFTAKCACSSLISKYYDGPVQPIYEQNDNPCFHSLMASGVPYRGRHVCRLLRSEFPVNDVYEDETTPFPERNSPRSQYNFRLFSGDSPLALTNITVTSIVVSAVQDENDDEDDDDKESQSHTKKRLKTGERHTASMDIPPTLGRHTASMDIPPTLGRHTASMDIPPTLGRHTASMDIPPTLERRACSVNTALHFGRRSVRIVSMPNLAVEPRPRNTEDKQGGL
ncbi:uncharacterized protein [Hoplias malabaricus]|uniref:uncharacterized protein isoform X3 n=1 Tax=Hoplias malabaricus TaxID=27720 RepID=UPI0034630B35